MRSCVTEKCYREKMARNRTNDRHGLSSGLLAYSALLQRLHDSDTSTGSYQVSIYRVGLYLEDGCLFFAHIEETRIVGKMREKLCGNEKSGVEERLRCF